MKTFLSLLGCWLGVAALTTVVSAHPFHSAMRATWAPLAIALVILVARFELWAWARAACVVFVTVLALDVAWQGMFGVDVLGQPPAADRLRGFLGHANDVAVAVVMVPAIVETSALVWIVVALIVLASGSRNAALGYAVVAFALSPRKLRVCITTAGVFGLAGYVLARSNPLYGSERFGQWAIGLEMFKASPWFGQGPHSYIDHYLRYVGQPLMFGTPLVDFIPWAHSLYIEQLAERGIVGAVAFTVPLVFAWRAGGTHVRAALAAFGAMSIFDLTFLKPWVVGAYWSIVAVALCVKPSHVH